MISVIHYKTKPKKVRQTVNSSLRINQQRLLDSIDTYAAIGGTAKGGVRRLALTDEDKRARDLFVATVKAAGCQVRIDRMGNIFARRSGRDTQLDPVLMGSHGDSQPTGGRYDGIYGVLGGLEVIHTLNDHQVETERPVDLVMWTNEEGSRFAPAMIGSAVFAGASSLEYGLSRTDVGEKTLGAELDRIGYAGIDNMTGYRIHAAFELHIEQGPILEHNQKTIGVVTDAQGQRWYEIALTGVASHAGTTPMGVRHDALLGLAHLVEAVNQIGLKESPDGRATVGMVQVSPNSRNVIPGETWLAVEFRHPSETVLQRMDERLQEAVTAVSAKLGLESNLKQIFAYPPVPFAPTCVQAVRQAAESLGYSHQNIISGAGHDACHLARIAPTSMIFVPCVDGLSHNEAENITPEWAEAGVNVLLQAVLQKAVK